jgi:CDP-diglyceride synthetase
MKTTKIRNHLLKRGTERFRMHLLHDNKDTNSLNAMMAEMVREEQAALRKLSKNLIIDRSVSALIAIFYLIFFLFKGNGQMTFRLLLSLVLPMAAIRFADELGSMTGVRFGRFYGPEVTGSEN